MRFELNLIMRSQYHRKSVRRLLGAVIALCGVVLLVQVAILLGGYAVKNRLSQELEQAQLRLAGAPAGIPDKELNERRQLISVLNGLIERKTSSRWLVLFDALEEVVPDGVALTKMTREPKGDGIKLEGRAVGFPAIRLLLENMERSGRFRGAQLVSHGEAQAGERMRSLQFVVAARVIQP